MRCIATTENALDEARVAKTCIDSCDLAMQSRYKPTTMVKDGSQQFIFGCRDFQGQ